MGKCSNGFFSETTNIIKAKLYMNVHWMVLYKLIPVNLWELLGGDLPTTNSAKGEILCVAFKRTKLYLVVAYM